MVLRVCEVTRALDFIFQLMLCSCEDVFNQYYLYECVEMHQTVLLVYVVQELPTRNTA